MLRGMVPASDEAVKFVLAEGVLEARGGAIPVAMRHSTTFVRVRSRWSHVPNTLLHGRIKRNRSRVDLR